MFEVGIPTVMNIAVGDRYLVINNGASGDRTIKFTISKDSSSTTIVFTDATAVSVTKKTGTNNGTFGMNVGTSAGFGVQCIVSDSGITIKTASSIKQRYAVSGYSI